jgi:putative endopeptidase
MKSKLIGLVLLVGCAAAGAQSLSLNDKAYGTWGVDLAARDLTVRPGDDFDYYAGGSWAKATPIPPDSSFAGPYQDLRRLSEARLHAIIETSPTSTPVGALYRSFMDEAGVERRGAAPLQTGLNAIDAAKDRDALAILLAKPGLGGEPFEIYISKNPHNALKHAMGVWQTGLGLPDRDYYLLERFAPQRKAYLEYIGELLRLSGDTNSVADAATIAAFETEIAKRSMSRTDSNDPAKTINMMPISALTKVAPRFPWTRYIAAKGITVPATEQINVGPREAIIAISEFWSTTPLPTLKAWARFRLENDAAPYLPKAFVDANVTLTKALSGVKSAPTRERRGIILVDRQLGEMIGRDYAARYFDPARKTAMLTLVANVKAAMRRRLEANDWLTPATKAKALVKLDRMTVQVGYPDRWREYPGLSLKPGDLYGNIEACRASAWRWEVSQLKAPVDKRLWALTPQTVNAYNGGQELKIVFPAARLQPPFFGLNNDPAANYGAIGAIIGHELSHSFDDAGRRIDADGNFKDWWTPQDTAAFEQRIAVLGAQYDAIEPLPGVHINGKLTMGENIADVAGVLAALDAYHAMLGGKPAPIINGLTGDQRFFLAYAQARREKQTDDDLRDQLSSDEHAPSRYRVIGAVRNVDAWYDAFAVAPTDRYFIAPNKRARIW